MKLAIVQLSDIHIRNFDDPILKKAEQIASAAKSVAGSPHAYLLAITGDVAYSGKTGQYDAAQRLFADIIRHLEFAEKPVFDFFIPGNHDLDFSSEPDTRPVLLESVREKIDALDAKGETVRQILSVQKNFFEFEASAIKSMQRPIHDWLLYSHSFSLNDKTIRVNCFNTAWASTNPEIPGQLVFPTAAIDLKGDPTDLVISAFHHPYNWLSPENARSFRQRVESSSDVVMTGHEHEASVFVKQNSNSGTTQYIEGAVLQDHSNDRSAFNVVLIDTTEGTYEAFACQWTGRLYEHSSSGIHKFVRNTLVCKSAFRNNPNFAKRLSDPGLPILHPFKQDIALEDLYIYPALAHKNPERKFEVLKVIESANVVGFIRSTPRLIVSGEDTIGKTSFAKTIYRDLKMDGDFVPILISGEDFSGTKENDLRKLVRNTVIEQYDEASVEDFLRLEHRQRTVIIDDWHSVKYAAKGRVSIIEHLKGLFGKIICLTNRLYAFEELAETGPLGKVLADFQFCDIEEFGKRLTGKLIEKWHMLGREYSSDAREYYHAVASSEQKISTLIGKGVLPTYPIFLLGLLQADTAASSAAQSAGSYGHILESVITARLAKVSARSTDIGLMYTYASRIAYAILKKDRPFLSSREISEIHKQYCDTYQLRLSETKVIKDLINARLLSRDGDCYRFTYRGCYCYFVARYFAENLLNSGSELRPELNDMTDRLGYEDFTNIIMFFLYLTRDPEIIERLLVNSAKIYQEWQPSDLEDDVQFVNKLLKEKPKRLVLPSTDIESNRDQYRSKQDEAEQKQNELAVNPRVPYDSSANEIVKLTIALQNLRVMGQVLRNFPGVLKAEPKYRLAEASYLLGLRTLRRLLALAEEQLETLRATFAEVFKEGHPLATVEELENSADQKLIWLTGAVSYGMIKRICSSIGLQDLELTFEEVRKKLGEKTSVKLVDLAIHLEYFRGAPEAQIYDVEDAVQKKNLFAYKILRDLVAEFLYLHNTDRQVLQRLGKLFDIAASNPQYLLNKAVGTE